MIWALAALALAPVFAALLLSAWAAALGEDGHFRAGRFVIYGRGTAMHRAFNFWTDRWGYVCVRLPTVKWGRLVLWKIYVSRDGTPGGASWGIGPGMERHDLDGIARRRQARRTLIAGIDAMGVDDFNRVAGMLERDESVVLSYPSSAAVEAYEAERDLYAGRI